MCYSGACDYENSFGECTVRFGGPFPEDAACVKAERESDASTDTE